jgi:signal transduction histidine kinase
MEIVANETPDADIRLTAQPDLEVHSHKGYLGGAIANVLRNAYKYAGEGGLIEVEVREEGAWVRIEVRDKGPGVPEGDLHLLAKPFFRSRSNTTQPGAGIGLSIVKYCIGSCGGNVHFANREPSGFVVAMRIPKSLQG